MFLCGPWLSKGISLSSVAQTETRIFLRGFLFLASCNHFTTSLCYFFSDCTNIYLDKDLSSGLLRETIARSHYKDLPYTNPSQSLIISNSYGIQDPTGTLVFHLHLPIFHIFSPGRVFSLTFNFGMISDLQKMCTDQIQGSCRTLTNSPCCYILEDEA